MISAGEGRPFWALLTSAALVAVAIKLFISFQSTGTIDVVYWQQFLELIRSGGGAVYRRHELFNHPPFMIHVLRGLGALADASGLPLPFWLRLPGILADAGSVFLVWLIVRRSLPDLERSVLLLLLALAPASIMIAGYHGNTDPLMMFLVLLAVYLMEAGPPWAAGIAFGMAMSIKVVPLIFAPVFVSYRRTIRSALVFAAAAGATFTVAGMPYVLEDPAFMAQQIFGYAGGNALWWGLPLLFRMAEEHLRFQAVYSEAWSAVPGMLELYWLTSTISAAYARWGAVVLLASVAVLSVWLNRSARRPPLFLQCGIVAFLFLLLAPGFGLQYLAWLVPWVVAAGPLAAMLFYEGSGAFLYWLYVTNLSPSGPMVQLSLACWASIGIALLGFWRRVQVSTRAPDSAPVRRAWPRLVARTALAGLAAGVVLVALLRATGVALTPLALETPFVIASSSYDGFPAQAAVDGRSDASAWNGQGGWNSAATPSENAPEYLTFLFPAQRAVGQLTLFSYPEARFALRSFVFQYRADGQWRDIEETRVRDNTEATRWTFEFPGVTTRQLRLLVFAAADMYARVLEVEFGGSTRTEPVCGPPT